MTPHAGLFHVFHGAVRDPITVSRAVGRVGKSRLARIETSRENYDSCKASPAIKRRKDDMSDYNAYGMTELLYEAADTSALLGDAVQSSKADALLSRYNEIMSELEWRIEESKQPHHAARAADDRAEPEGPRPARGRGGNVAVIVYQPDATPDHPYNLQIYTDGCYCGNGRFCESEAEAVMCAKDRFGVSEESVLRIGFEGAAAKPAVGYEGAKAVASMVSGSRDGHGRARGR